jgi:hypothetical protein
MRWFFNCLLVLAGLPLVGTSLVLIGSFSPVSGEEIPWPIRLCFFAVWLGSLALLTLVYTVRTRWLERIGICQSWSNFEAYLRESHRHPCVSEEQKTEFLSWAGLSEERPAQFRTALRALYTRIRADVAAEEQRRLYIRCLAWYAEGWPAPEDCYDWYEDNDAHVASRNP